MNELTAAHIRGQQALRETIVTALTRLWRSLPGYDREDLDPWLKVAVPLVLASQRQSVALTDAYLARSLERRPLGINASEVIGSAVRGGTPIDEVYTRPFVTMWSGLKEGRPYESAANAALARATSMAAMDVQLAMRATAEVIGEADGGIYGYLRRADADACDFCLKVDGAFVKSGSSMALHNHCGCGLEALTSKFRGPKALPDGVAVHEHGELGAVLTDRAHDFTSAAQALA